ncbi:MAG TPA: hypothetical protein VNM22_08370 [Candidatus Limnocylindrales bacterium]|nr:hypothetical protein [Candidatus Limnocylindrales bacterium]
MWWSRLKWSIYLAYHLRGQTRFPFEPLEVIQRAQARRVQSMIAYAYHRVPYYRRVMDNLGLSPGDFRTAEDLSRLPILERKHLQQNPEDLVSTAQPRDYYLKLRTGRSTHTHGTVYHDATSLFQNAAHGERERSMIVKLVGRSLGYRETSIATSSGVAKEVHKFCQKHGFLPKGIRIQRQYLPLDPPEKNVPLINEFKPDVLHSYGSYLEVLFPYLYTTGVPFHRPKIVTYSSDGLSNPVRRLITETFGLPLLSTYQATEAFKIGFECFYNMGLHLNIDLYPVRIVNEKGETLPDGESGDVILSNLVNRATVLLNYRLGDIACILPGPCPCGRSLPRLSLPQARSDDWIQLTSGRLIHPMRVKDVFLVEEELWQYQIVQESGTHFRIALVASGTCNRQAMAQRITHNLNRILGEDITINLTFTDQIPRTPGGKVRTVLSLRQKPQGETIFDGIRSYQPYELDEAIS